MEKVQSINQAIKEYFEINTSVTIIPAKDLMPWFIEKGIFDKDRRNGLPIRNILRSLDAKNQLSLIPFAKPERKESNTSWYFVSTDKAIYVYPKKATVVKGKGEKLKGRSGSDEAYVIDLSDEVLNRKASRQHTFDFLRGDPNDSGVTKCLPVDAYYPELNLVVEFQERQHTEPVKHFDKRMTVSGVTRGEQRKIYDQRKLDVLANNGIRVTRISYSDFSTIH